MVLRASKIVTIHEAKSTHRSGTTLTSLAQDLTQPTLTLNTEVMMIKNKDKPLLENIRSIVTADHYSSPLQQNLMKDNMWDEDTFQMIAWRDFERALQTLPRSHRVSIMKLTHQLWNTNTQSHKYYGDDDKCPICGDRAETTHRVHTCQHKSAALVRKQTWETLMGTMSKGTPIHLMQAIENAVERNLRDSDSSIDASQLNEAVAEAIEAQNSIGWDGFFRGHIAIK
jgi:hypothetical protein